MFNLNNSLINPIRVILGEKYISKEEIKSKKQRVKMFVSHRLLESKLIRKRCYKVQGAHKHAI